MSDFNIETDFGINLIDIRDRVATLEYFTSVQDLQDVSQVMAGEVAFVPPASFVQVARETWEANRYAAGGRGQRATTQISILSCLQSMRAAGDGGDEVEQARKAIIAVLTGFQPGGAQKGLSPTSYAVRMIADGLIWFEVIMTTTWDLVGVREPTPPAP